MSKAFKDSEKGAWTVVRIILLLVVVAFTTMGFIIEQPCDIDSIYLWCRLHPMSIGDWIGCGLFYGSALVLSGLTPIKFWNDENNTRGNWIMFAILILSIVLIWNT